MIHIACEAKFNQISFSHKLSYSNIFCRLDKKRGHDKNLIKLVNTYLEDHDTDGL